MPTFFAKAGLCAAAAIVRACFAELLGIVLLLPHLPCADELLLALANKRSHLLNTRLAALIFPYAVFVETVKIEKAIT